MSRVAATAVGALLDSAGEYPAGDREEGEIALTGDRPLAMLSDDESYEAALPTMSAQPLRSEPSRRVPAR